MLLKRDETALVVVDVQERLAKVMKYRRQLVRNMEILVTAAKRLEVPYLTTLQYPRGLGPTVDELSHLLEDGPQIEKLSFDCCGEPTFMAELERIKPKSVLLCGMETHICVLQTAVSLMEHGYSVHVPGDAVCSRKKEHWKNGLSRMQRYGVEITSTESALFELLGVAGTPEFKELSRLITD